MAKKIITQATPDLNQKPRVDFKKDSFDALVWQKGLYVNWEKAIACPCKKEGSSPRPDCRNCRGIGWIFVDIVDTRMVVQNINIDTKVKSWSLENLGRVSITALSTNPLSFMDRITIRDNESINQEVIYPKSYNGDLILSDEEDILMTDEELGLLIGSPSHYAYLNYSCLDVLYIALFVGVDDVLEMIPKDQYRIENNVIYFSDLLEDKQVTIRYKHNPQYHILDIHREVMNTQVINSFSGKEELKDLPIHAMAKRAQYVIDPENTTQDLNLINNSE